MTLRGEGRVRGTVRSNLERGRTDEMRSRIA
jgi:hypothetical protein